MVSFEYLIHDPMGLHARPVGTLVKAVKPFRDASITVRLGDKTADAKRMFTLMALQAKQGDTIVVEVQGENEQEIADTVKAILEAEKL